MTGSSVVFEMSRGLPSGPLPSHQCFGTISNWPRMFGSSVVLLVEGEGDVALAGLFGLDDMLVVVRREAD